MNPYRNFCYNLYFTLSSGCLKNTLLIIAAIVFIFIMIPGIFFILHIHKRICFEDTISAQKSINQALVKYHKANNKYPEMESDGGIPDILDVDNMDPFDNDQELRYYYFPRQQQYLITGMGPDKDHDIGIQYFIDNSVKAKFNMKDFTDKEYNRAKGGTADGDILLFSEGFLKKEN